MKRKLTTKALEALKADGVKANGDPVDQRWYWEPFDRGGSFAVRVTRVGKKPPYTYSKSFVYQYSRNGRNRRITIGRYPAWSIKEAREEAHDLATRVRDGGDPAREAKAGKRDPMTVGAFLDEYMKRHSKPHKKSWKEDERRVKRIKRTLGSILLADLTTPDVAGLHRKLRKGKGVEANRVVELLTAALNLARKWGHLDESARNAAAGVKRFKERSRERFLKGDEIPRVVAAIDKEPDPFTRAAIMTTLYCGLRKSEALALRWRDVDLGRGSIYVRARKTDDARTVPLPREACAMFEALPRIASNPFVFAGMGDGHISVSTINRAWGRIREDAEIEDVTLHDLRRTCGSLLAMRGVSLLKIGAILGHKDARATMIYARLQPDVGRDELEGSAAEIHALVNGDDEKIAGRIKREAV